MSGRSEQSRLVDANVGITGTRRRSWLDENSAAAQVRLEAIGVDR